ncbi:hypothetical protein GCM10020331_043110 [Ectobacillus funiculus]
MTDSTAHEKNALKKCHRYFLSSIGTFKFYSKEKLVDWRSPTYTVFLKFPTTLNSLLAGNLYFPTV